MELGFRYIEIDLRTTADGVLVLFHDAVLDRATGSTGTISSMTWDELAQVTVQGSDGTECSCCASRMRCSCFRTPTSTWT
ncbi:hypothetical protein [Nesterenkonia pannonica]|uniref:glycerophosphodiester phosphodiesterase n=1 Tax=Nesterenkonia pannonica TaxID=1548602 RepID=UPI002164C04D|nr:glycerophosphodiester phosphodiesterase family protein [Nesterenkonia pannonica]